MTGITISTQRQLELDYMEDELKYRDDPEKDEIIKQYTEYQLYEAQGDG